MATENFTRKPRVSGKTFRLSKTAKRRLALQSFVSADVRAAYRRMMIEAQVASTQIIKRDKNDKTTRGAPLAG